MSADVFPIIRAPVHTAPMVGCYSDAGCTVSVGPPVPDGATCCALHGNSVFHDEGGGCTACAPRKYKFASTKVSACTL